ncbi:MAG: GLPGLI family protein [Bacteroidota bacterium]|nr:GLPGLI family protein [Bacteroidota bacterium]MXW13814.1 GLPGLI family protein [Rhodothermaceae bacterium]MDE2646041.1 GLPGLI family protein [Bacteroidota bacterium]MXW33320.1 GLPGLI family protein [Rhodothermaceae bacterium]MXZ18177.1 GLPGLI family protein [Rhodothermaceae bacterium]
MRYLILLFALAPSTLLAQDGTVEYSTGINMKMPSMETIMEIMPPDMPLDSTMIEQMLQEMSQMPEQFFTLSMHMKFSDHKSFLTPDFSSLASGAMGQLGAELPVQVTYVDYMEGTVLTQVPTLDQSTTYLMTQKYDAIDWTLVDSDSTILDFPVNKATFSSDTLNIVAWYSPAIPSKAGPMQFGGLPGLPLQMKADMDNQGFRGSFDIVAIRLEEGLEGPITPPEGTLVTPEELLEIISKQLEDLGLQ